MKIININKALKNIRIGVLVFLAVLTGTTFQSCADLDPDPQKFNLPPGSYASLADLDKGITGVYADLNFSSRMTTFYAAAWAGDDMTSQNNSVPSSNKQDFIEFDVRSVQSSNGRLQANWENVYAVINTINAVLDNSLGLEGAEVDQDILNQYIGEAYFLRGIMLHKLTRIHGRIPIPLTVIPDPNIARSPIEDVYLQIESDLIEAVNRLPEVYPGVEKGAPRPNRGSAKALLSRVYLDWAGFPLKDTSKYDTAATMAKEVIDNAGTNNFALMDDLEDLWKVENKYNDESIFTISFCQACGNRPSNLKYGILGLPNDIGSGWSETFAEVRFFDDFPEGARKEATYRTDLPWETSTNQKSPIFKKIVGADGDLPAGAFFTNRNDFYMRYAEVLLIYAEASGRSGNVNSDAWEALNMIRRRAAGLPYATPDVSVDLSSGDLGELAFTERKWELAGEYLRWFDLIRMEKVEEALTLRDQIGTINIQEHSPIFGSLSTDNYFSPIPASAVDLNPNLSN